MVARFFVTSPLVLCLLLAISSCNQVIAAENSTVSAASTSVRVDRLGDPLPKNALLRLGTLRLRHPSSVADLALSPDQKTVVSIGGQELIVWDVETGKPRWQADLTSQNIRPSAAAYCVRALVFAPDGKEFYTTGKENELIAWDTHSGQHKIVSINPELPPHTFNLILGQASTRSVDVSPDGNRLAVGSPPGIVVCDQSGKVMFKVVNSPASQIKIDDLNRDRLLFYGHYSYARFSPDGKVLAVVVSEMPEEMRLLDAKTGAELRRITTTARIVRLDFSPDSNNIIATERDSAARLYSVNTATELWSYKIKLTNKSESYTSAVAFNPDGKSLAVCAPIGSEYDIHLLNAVDGKLITKLIGHTSKPWALAFGKDGKMLYSSGWDGAVRRWDIEAHSQLQPPQGVRGTSVAAASPDGNMLAYADDTGTIHLVNSTNADEIRTLVLPGISYSYLTFSPDSQQLAGGGNSDEDVHVAIWDLASGKTVARWDWPKGDDTHSAVDELRYSPNNKYLAAAVFRQDAVQLWDLATKEKVAQMMHLQVYGFSFSSDSKTMATVGWDSLIQLWDTEYGELDDVVLLEEASNSGRDNRMYTACYSPQGDLLATAHLDDTVRIWRVDGMLLLRKIEMKSSFSYGALSFSPDGLWMATGTTGQVAIVDPYKGEVVWDGGRHEDHVYMVEFGRDSETVLSGGDDGVCYLWQTKPLATQANDDFDDLWINLSSGGKAAYLASWAFVESPDRAVEFLAEKLLPVNRLLAPVFVPLGDSTEKLEQQRQRNRKLIVEDETVEHSITARHAISILARIDTSASKELLQQLFDRNPESELGRLVATTLARVDQSK